jgi:ribosomal protein S12 methylthiotransferase accessory factor
MKIEKRRSLAMHPLVLDDAFKTFTLDQDKVLSPLETVERFREKLAGVRMDVLKETVRIDNGRLGIPVYISRCGADARRIIGTKKQMGKGATPQQAEASAVMELAERFSFFSFVQTSDNFRRNTFAGVGGPAMNFEMIARSVHDDSDDLPASRRIFESLPFNWTWGFNLTQGAAVRIPFDWFFAINEFNGPSAGNCKEEAILQGICEVVERHVSSVISHERLAVPAIQPETAQDPMVIEMLAKYGRCGIHLAVSDFTLGMGIPSVGVLAYDPASFPDRSEIVWTAGTTPSPEKAFSRALTEVAQLAGDFNTSANYVASGLPKFKRLQDARYITEPGTWVDLASLPDVSHANIRVEIENCVQALARRGLEVFLIETTHPQLGIPAYYTIIPGAHFRERSRTASVAMFSARHITQTLPPSAAIPALEAIDSTLPGRYYLQFYLGLTRLNAGEPETALGHFRRALELDPDESEMPSIFSYMGLALKETERYSEALEWLGKGAALDPERTDFHNLMGFCHFKRGEHEQAVAAFQRVINLDPTSAIDYANLGVNYEALGETEKAIHCLQMALTLDPGIDFARSHLARLTG